MLHTEMRAVPTRPVAWEAHGSIILRPRRSADPCASCDGRLSSVCNAIPDSDLARLASVAVVVNAPAGRTVIDEGEPASHFFNVIAGTVKLVKMLPDGRQQIIGFAGVGHFLGLAVSDTYAFSATAIEPVRYCRFTRAKLLALLDDFPLMEKRLLEVTANELVTAQEQMLLLGRKTARERVASFLLMQSHRGEPSHQPGDSFRLPMHRADIADYLGMALETVSRALSRFRSDRIIDLPTVNEVVIHDRAAIESIAGGLASDGQGRKL